MLQRSLERETLHYLRPDYVPRSGVKNNLCHWQMGTGAKVIAMRGTIIGPRQHAEAVQHYLLLPVAFLEPHRRAHTSDLQVH